MERILNSLLWIVVLVTLTTGAYLPQNAAHRAKRQVRAEDLVDECSMADIVFAVDSSGSIGADNWKKVINFVKSVVSEFPVGNYGTRIGLVNFANSAKVEFQLNKYQTQPEIVAALDDVKWKDQETNTSGALWKIKEEMFSTANGDRRRAPNVAIVITDGESNRDQNKTVPYAKELKATGVTVFAIGIGNKTNNTELLGIAENSSYVFNVDNFAALKQIREKLVMSACDIPVTCGEIGDIAFLLDNSGSVRHENFNKMKEAVKKIIDNINVGRNENSHIGVITFNNSAFIEFGLAQHDTRDDNKAAIDKILYSHGTTNTAAALRLLRNEFFRGRYDRANVKNVGILFTDGGSNDFEETIKEARLTREQGIVLIVVAITDWVKQFEVNEIATDPDKYNVHNVKTFDEVGSIVKDIKQVLCNEFDECESNPCRNNGICVEMTNSYVCKCAPGYAGIHCERSCSSPADFVVALDSSTSIGKDNYYLMIEFIKHLARSLGVSGNTVRMGLETYASTTFTRFYLNKYETTAQVVNGISTPYRSGTTNTAGALENMNKNMFNKERGDRPEAKNVALVMTDGYSDDRKETFEQARELRNSGVNVIAVGINLNTIHGQTELEGIASDPDEKNVIHIPNFDALYNITDQIVDAVCDAVDECASNPCLAGGTCINKMNMYECICTEGRSGVNCERTCDGQSDVIFVVDASGSIRENRFSMLMDYVRNVTFMLEVSPQRTRVGLVTFSDEAEIIFHLNTYTAKEDIMQTLHYVPYVRGRTNTASALELLRTQMFTPENGDRPNAPNYAVVISDGQSNIKPENTIPEAVLARQEGIHIIAISLGENKRRLEIKGIASDPDEYNIMDVKDYDTLPQSVVKLVNTMCDEVNECESNPCLRGQCIDGLGHYLCDCAAENDRYAGPNCERRCTREMDIAFVLDASGSVEKNFDLSLKLTRRIIEGLNFERGRTQIGVVTYSDDAKVQFHLNSDKQSVLNALAFTQEMGKTYTARAIKLMQDDIFSRSFGDRTGVDNIAVVITDGRSNIREDLTLPFAEDAKDAGIEMVAVGIGQNGDVDRAEVNGIASDPDSDHAFVLTSEDDLDIIASDILEVLCQ